VSKEKIVEFLTKMNNQDNRCTAFPFFYQIRDYRKQYRPRDHGSDVEYYSSELECSFDSEGEMVEYYIEHYYKDDLDDVDLKDHDFDEMFEKWKDSKDITRFYYEMEECFKGLFFTEEDAKEHLRRNYYHYSAKADTYVQHAWRAPELEGFLGNLMDYFEIEGDNRRK